MNNIFVLTRIRHLSTLPQCLIKHTLQTGHDPERPLHLTDQVLVGDGGVWVRAIAEISTARQADIARDTLPLVDLCARFVGELVITLKNDKQ